MVFSAPARRSALIAAVAIAGLASGAAARPLTSGSPLVMPEDGAASIRFVSSDAGASGALYFLGSEFSGTITYAPSSDSRGLGQFLFSNKNTLAGATASLGLYPAGAKLHFAYVITSGSGGATTGALSRSDLDGDLLYFGQSPAGFNNGVYSMTLGIEDIRVPGQSDFDYNDAVFALDVTPQTVPSPGTISLAVCAGMFLFSRGRARRIA